MNYRKKWDVFICHASEDKREIADPLANKLTSMGLKVWYDKFSMRWGSRLMKEIDNGLVNSKYGIVILSNALLHYIAPEFQTHRLMAVTILGRTLNFQQLFSICWESWKKGLKEIESEYCYSEYLKPLLQIFDQASSEHKEAVRDEILKYLEDPVVMIRKRALDIYKLYFV